MIQRTKGAERARLERATQLYLAYCYSHRTPARTSELAAHMHLSLSYLSRLVPRVTGQSLHSYLRERQLARAAALLEATSAPLALIAEECGFGTISTFHRIFTGHFRETPAAWRATRQSRPRPPLLLRPRPATVEPILSFDGDLFREVKKC